jgi:trigger factor
MQMGLPPQKLAQSLTENNQIPALVAEVLRSKALNLIVEKVKITEESGTGLDLEAIRAELDGPAAETDEAEAEEVEEVEAPAAEATEEAPKEAKATDEA